MLNLQRLYNLLKERVEFVDGYPPLNELTSEIIRANQKRYTKLYADIIQELLSWSNAAAREVYHDHWWRGKVIVDENDLKAIYEIVKGAAINDILEILDKYGLEEGE